MVKNRVPKDDESRSRIVLTIIAFLTVAVLIGIGFSIRALWSALQNMS